MVDAGVIWCLQFTAPLSCKNRYIMKLFSRKALAAVATTFALTTAGVSAPAMAAPSSVTTILAADEGDGQDSSEDTTTAPSESSADGDKEKKGKPAASSDTDEILDWAKAATAIIGVLTAVFTFVQKLG